MPVRYHWLSSVLMAVWALTGGCGGADFGDVQVSPDQAGGPPRAGADRASLEFPADRRFNIHLKNSSQNPGTGGRARGDSDADATGRAFCLADTADGGSALAEFRLGQRIEHAADRPQRAAIRLDFQVQHSLQAAARPMPKTRAAIDLQFVVMDARKHVLARLPLVLLTSDHAVGSASETHQRQVFAVLEPGQTYDMMLYAKGEASSEAGQEAAARLDVQELKMRLDLTPVATQPAADQAGTQPGS